MSISTVRYEKDFVMQELLNCNGNLSCILIVLDKLALYGCDFTLSEIGDVLHVTRERVRQIEASAIKKLKHPKMGRVIKAYLES
jgi:hypothetical protein